MNASIFEQENVVLTLIYGKLINHELTAHVLEMNRDYNGIKGMREIADCRHLFDVSELASNNLLVSAGMEEGSSRTIGGKGAIVVASDLIHGLANMYATVASCIRDDSRVYRSMNEALDWLEVEPIRHKIESITSKEMLINQHLLKASYVIEPFQSVSISSCDASS